MTWRTQASRSSPLRRYLLHGQPSPVRPRRSSLSPEPTHDVVGAGSGASTGARGTADSAAPPWPSLGQPPPLPPPPPLPTAAAPSFPLPPPPPPPPCAWPWPHDSSCTCGAAGVGRAARGADGRAHEEQLPARLAHHGARRAAVALAAARRKARAHARRELRARRRAARKRPQRALELAEERQHLAAPDKVAQGQRRGRKASCHLAFPAPRHTRLR